MRDCVEHVDVLAAEPRVFKLAPGEPRAGLQSGDVILLRQQVWNEKECRQKL